MLRRSQTDPLREQKSISAKSIGKTEGSKKKKKPKVEKPTNTEMEKVNISTSYKIVTV